MTDLVKGLMWYLSSLMTRFITCVSVSRGSPGREALAHFLVTGYLQRSNPCESIRQRFHYSEPWLFSPLRNKSQYFWFIMPNMGLLVCWNWFLKILFTNNNPNTMQFSNKSSCGESVSTFTVSQMIDAFSRNFLLFKRRLDLGQAIVSIEMINSSI